MYSGYLFAYFKDQVVDLIKQARTFTNNDSDKK